MNVSTLAGRLLVLLLTVLVTSARADQGDERPNVSGTYLGVYFYGYGYGVERQGKPVKFRLKIKQEKGARTFTGEIDEEVTDFGTAKDGRLWATVLGEVTEGRDGLKIAFQKTYLYFEQESVSYKGLYDAARKSFDGKFLFPGDAAQGVFTFQRIAE